MDARQERGLQIAAKAPINKGEFGFVVPSETTNGKAYIVAGEATKVCTCPDFAERHQPCKHIFAVEFVIQRQQLEDGTETYMQAVRVTYGQRWSLYNAAQTNEGEYFVRLLRDLCEGIPQPPQGIGRPRLPLGDVVFALAQKTYGMMSGRRSATALRNACSDGLVAHAGHYNSLFRYLENPALTPLLKELVAQTAAPVAAIESDFAADSSGFATNSYTRWFDVKWGKVRSQAKFIKCHIMTGVTTNIITAIEATPEQSSDSRQFPYLVTETAKRFDVREVSADKAYSARGSIHAAVAVGATPYIPFQDQATGGTSTKHRKPDALWARAWHYYNYHRAEFTAHYHKRSNVETTFSMIKAKFGASVRAKTPVAQVNEVLLKAVCHNIVVLIQTMYEFNIAPEFWQGADVRERRPTG